MTVRTGTAGRGALHGLRVVDFGQYLAGPLVAMVLADLGADVVRVDPPGGPRWRTDANAVLQRGKRSIVLDLTRPADAEVARGLVDRADIVVEGFRPGVMARLGLGPQESVMRNPGLVYCSLPGFGHDDPRAGVPAWEGVVNAAAGLFVEPPGAGRPVYNALPLASSYGAAVAAHSVLAALIARERDGHGQWVEVPLFDAAFEAIGQLGQRTEFADPVPYRPTRDMPPPIGHYRCEDGRWLHLCLLQDRHLQWFADEFLPADWVADGMADAERLWTDPNMMVRAKARFAALFATRTALEWERAINERSGAPSALCATTEQWLRDDRHARDIGAVIALDDPSLGPTLQAGHPITMSATPPRAAGPRHPLDADRDVVLAEVAGSSPAPRRPGAPRLAHALAGIRVVDLTQVLAGPTSARVLAEYGADVVKVQNAGDNQHRYHLYGNSGKRSIILDLKAPEGQEVLGRLIDGVDVVVENFARGVAERLGVGEDDVRRRSPAVVYATVSAYGRAGYRGGYRGREELGQAVTGMQVRWGGYGPDDEPLQGPLTYTDSMSGLYAALAILVGLYHRLRTGEGQAVESSLAHAGTYHQIPFMIAYSGRTWDEPHGWEATGQGPLDRIYQAADRWLYLAAPGDGDRERLRTVEGLHDLVLDDEDEKLTDQLTEILRGAPAADWVARLTAVGVGAHVVLEIDEVMRHPTAVARGLSTMREHPGIGPVRNPGPSRRLSATPAVLTAPAGPPGHDTRALLADLGLGDRTDELIRRGVVRTELAEGIDLFGRPR